MPGTPWGTFATSPDADSGRFNNKFASALPPLGNTYPVRCPVVKHDLDVRGARDVLCSAVWESLAEEVASQPGMLAAAGEKRWPPVYERHQLIQEARQKGLRLPSPLQFTLMAFHPLGTLQGVSTASLESGLLT